MTNYKRLFKHSLAAFILAATTLFAAPQTARASDPEFDSITNHLKLHYNARRVHIPFLGLANFFVKIVRPAGVKSFKVAVFENLNFTPKESDSGLALVMRNALSADWQQMVRVRSRDATGRAVRLRGYRIVLRSTGISPLLRALAAIPASTGAGLGLPAGLFA